MILNNKKWWVIAIGPSSWGRAETLEQAITNMKVNWSQSDGRMTWNNVMFVLTDDPKAEISELDGYVAIHEGYEKVVLYEPTKKK